jgi:hypothetical protein
VSWAWAQVPDNLAPAPLTVAQVVDRMVAENLARAQALESFSSTRTYTLAYKGFPAGLNAQMVVDLTYTAPNTKKFVVVSRSGPKWIQDQVMTRLLKSEQDAQRGNNLKNVDLNTQNYNFTDLLYRPAPDHCSYRVSVVPKSPSKYLYKGNVWIDDRAFAVCRLDVQPAKNPSFWIKHTHIAHSYEQVGAFWLPRKNESVSDMRFGGKATLIIQYGNYKILAAKPVAQYYATAR